MILCAAVFGGLLSRWHGSNSHVPRWLIQLFWSWFFILTTITVPTAIIAFSLCFAGISTGHGNGQDLGTWKGTSKPEKLEYLILWLKPYVDEYWYDVLLMAICGFSTISGGVFGFAWRGLYAEALIVSIGGLLCPVGYMIGWKLFPDNKKSLATEIGEFLTGFFGYGTLAIALTY